MSLARIFSEILPLVIAFDDSKFFACVLKSGGTVPPVQNVGYPGAYLEGAEPERAP